ITYQAAGRNLFVGKKSADHQGIAIQQNSAWLDHSVNFRKHRRAPRNVTKDIVREDRVKAAIFKWQRTRNVALLKLSNGSEACLARQLVGIPNPMRIEIQASDLATNFLG